MRNRSRFDYLRTGQLLKRIYQDGGSYETISRPFRYKSAGGTIKTSNQLMNGFMNTDEEATIEAITELDYAVGDKIITDDGSVSEIIRVQSKSFNELGRLRNIRRSAYLITIS